MVREFWEQELEQLLNQVAEYAPDWDEVLDMVAAADMPENQKMLYEYLRELVPRLKQMRREFNRVTYVNGGYVVSNYDFKMYSWAKKRGLGEDYITSFSLIFPPDFLTPAEVEQFNERREP